MAAKSTRRDKSAIRYMADEPTSDNMQFPISDLGLHLLCWR